EPRQPPLPATPRPVASRPAPQAPRRELAAAQRIVHLRPIEPPEAPAGHQVVDLDEAELLELMDRLVGLIAQLVGGGTADRFRQGDAPEPGRIICATTSTHPTQPPRPHQSPRPPTTLHGSPATPLVNAT